MGTAKRARLVCPGDRAPEFTLPLLDGGEASLQQLLTRGPVLLAFFKISCPVCQFTMPYLERLHRQGGLRVYGISQNEADDTREFNRHYGVTFPTLLDSEDAGFPVSNAYSISSVPTMFLVAPDGTLERVIEGWNRIDMAALGDRAGMILFHAQDNV